MKSRGQLLLDAVVLLALLPLLAGMGTILMQNMQAGDARAECQNHLRQIGVGMACYVDEWRWYPCDQNIAMLPEGEERHTSTERCFTLLIDGGYLGPDPAVFVCPASSDEPAGESGGLEGHVSYTYRELIQYPRDQQGAAFPLVVDRRWGEQPVTNHADGVNALFMDGRVEWLEVGSEGFESFIANPDPVYGVFLPAIVGPSAEEPAPPVIDEPIEPVPGGTDEAAWVTAARALQPGDWAIYAISGGGAPAGMMISFRMRELSGDLLILDQQLLIPGMEPMDDVEQVDLSIPWDPADEGYTLGGEELISAAGMEFSCLLYTRQDERVYQSPSFGFMRGLIRLESDETDFELLAIGSGEIIWPDR